MFHEGQNKGKRNKMLQENEDLNGYVSSFIDISTIFGIPFVRNKILHIDGSKKGRFFQMALPTLIQEDF